MFGASFLTSIWIAWVWAAVFVVLMIWKSVTGLQEENFVILEPAQRLPVGEHQALVARVGRVTLWAKYCGFASLGLLLIGAVVWVYRGIISFNAGLPP